MRKRSRREKSTCNGSVINAARTTGCLPCAGAGAPTVGLAVGDRVEEVASHGVDAGGMAPNVPSMAARPFWSSHVSARARRGVRICSVSG